jgi:hypothetical protein
MFFILFNKNMVSRFTDNENIDVISIKDDGQENLPSDLKDYDPHQLTTEPKVNHNPLQILPKIIQKPHVVGKRPSSSPAENFIEFLKRLPSLVKIVVSIGVPTISGLLVRSLLKRPSNNTSNSSNNNPSNSYAQTLPHQDSLNINYTIDKKDLQIIIPSNENTEYNDNTQDFNDQFLEFIQKLNPNFCINENSFSDNQENQKKILESINIGWDQDNTVNERKLNHLKNLSQKYWEVMDEITKNIPSDDKAINTESKEDAQKPTKSHIINQLDEMMKIKSKALENNDTLSQDNEIIRQYFGEKIEDLNINQIEKKIFSIVFYNLLAKFNKLIEKNLSCQNIEFFPNIVNKIYKIGLIFGTIITPLAFNGLFKLNWWGYGSLLIVFSCILIPDSINACKNYCKNKIINGIKAKIFPENNASQGLYNKLIKKFFKTQYDPETTKIITEATNYNNTKHNSTSTLVDLCKTDKYNTEILTKFPNIKDQIEAFYRIISTKEKPKELAKFTIFEKCNYHFKKLLSSRPWYTEDFCVIIPEGDKFKGLDETNPYSSLLEEINNDNLYKILIKKSPTSEDTNNQK